MQRISNRLNLASIMPEDTARRIVIVTDGNENVGQAKKLPRVWLDQGLELTSSP